MTRFHKKFYSLHQHDTSLIKKIWIDHVNNLNVKFFQGWRQTWNIAFISWEYTRFTNCKKNIFLASFAFQWYTSQACCWKLPSFCTIKPHAILCLLGWILPKKYWKTNAQSELLNVRADSKKVVSSHYFRFSASLITRNFWNFCTMLQR